MGLIVQISACGLLIVKTPKLADGRYKCISGYFQFCLVATVSTNC